MKLTKVYINGVEYQVSDKVALQLIDLIEGRLDTVEAIVNLNTADIEDLKDGFSWIDLD